MSLERQEASKLFTKLTRPYGLYFERSRLIFHFYAYCFIAFELPKFVAMLECMNVYGSYNHEECITSHVSVSGITGYIVSQYIQSVTHHPSDICVPMCSVDHGISQPGNILTLSYSTLLSTVFWLLLVSTFYPKEMWFIDTVLFRVLSHSILIVSSFFTWTKTGNTTDTIEVLGMCMGFITMALITHVHSEKYGSICYVHLLGTKVAIGLIDLMVYLRATNAIGYLGNYILMAPGIEKIPNPFDVCWYPAVVAILYATFYTEWYRIYPP